MTLALVLHSHLPWVRRNGTHPVGEEWLFQAWSEAYLPLLDVLERLAADGARDLLTVGVTPVLAEQLADPYLLAELHGWVGRRLLDLEHTISRYGASDRAALDPVWRHHWRRLTRLLETVEARQRGPGLLGALRALDEAGVIEVLGGPATHPYLPLLADQAVLRGQIVAGLDVTAGWLGRRPSGVWSPECGYRPAGSVGDPTRPPVALAADGTPTLARGADALPGLEAFWAEAGVDHLVVDGPTLAAAVGVGDMAWSDAGGAVLAPGGPLDVLDAPVWIADSDVAAFGRDLATTYAVWSPTGGYPADPAYRDFFAVDLEGGFKSWRVTDRAGLAKEPYDPDAAAARARAHADDFVALVERRHAGRPDGTVVVAAFDTELFGHWWAEGPLWLEAVLRRLAGHPRLRPTTLAAALGRRPPRRRLPLPESSWGAGKGHRAWVTESTRWLWQAVRDAEQRFATLPPGAARDLAWRELTLAQASDWPFLIVRDQAAQYAAERVRGHLERFAACCRGEELSAIAAIDDPVGTRAPVVVG